MADPCLSSLALKHFNYDEEIPFEELIENWSQMKNRLVAFNYEGFKIQVSLNLCAHFSTGRCPLDPVGGMCLQTPATVLTLLLNPYGRP